MSNSKKQNQILVGIVMGSQSDWIVMKEAVEQLDELEITNESLIISAHRTPKRIEEYTKSILSKHLMLAPRHIYNKSFRHASLMYDFEHFTLRSQIFTFSIPRRSIPAVYLAISHTHICQIYKHK